MAAGSSVICAAVMKGTEPVEGMTADAIVRGKRPPARMGVQGIGTRPAENLLHCQHGRRRDQERPGRSIAPIARHVQNGPVVEKVQILGQRPAECTPARCKRRRQTASRMRQSDCSRESECESDTRSRTRRGDRCWLGAQRRQGQSRNRGASPTNSSSCNRREYRCLPAQTEFWNLGTSSRGGAGALTRWGRPPGVRGTCLPAAVGPGPAGLRIGRGFRRARAG